MIIIIANVGRQGSRTIAFATGQLTQKQFFWDQSINPVVTKTEMVDVMCHGAANWHRWAQSAMDRWIDTDSFDRYFWPHFHRCYRSIG
jgi:hypothetical protein